MARDPNQSDALPSISDLNRQSVAAWTENTDFWIAHRNSSDNPFFNLMELPALERLTELNPKDRLLDLCTGNGKYAHHAASQGAIVDATDASLSMLHAAEQSYSGSGQVKFWKLDVTMQADLDLMTTKSETDGKYNVIVVNMGLMSVARIDLLARTIPAVLTADGRLVVTVLHPVFMSYGATRLIEFGADSTDDIFRNRFSVKVSKYLDCPPAKIKSIKSQPSPHISFHRTIAQLLSPFLVAGLVLDRLEELALPESKENKSRQFEWSNFSAQIPQVLAFRMRQSQ